MCLRDRVVLLSFVSEIDGMDNVVGARRQSCRVYKASFLASALLSFLLKWVQDCQVVNFFAP